MISGLMIDNLPLGCTIVTLRDLKTRRTWVKRRELDLGACSTNRERGVDADGGFYPTLSCQGSLLIPFVYRPVKVFFRWSCGRFTRSDVNELMLTGLFGASEAEQN
jgi:hypothetical protein